MIFMEKTYTLPKSEFLLFVYYIFFLFFSVIFKLLYIFYIHNKKSN